MVQVTYPGVYVQEVSSGVRPIAAAGTSTPAFVGLAERGPDDGARRITNWTEFQKSYGSFIKDGYLAESVFQFFNNGGRQCYIVRVTRSDAAAASVTLHNRAAPPIPGIEFSAKTKGHWGNYLYLQIEDGTADPGNTFKLSIRRQIQVDVVPSDFVNIAPLEVHDNLSMDANSPNYVETVLSRDSNLINAQVLPGNTSLQIGSYLGGWTPTLPLGNNRNFQINIDGDGYQEITLTASVSHSTSINAIATVITSAVKALKPKKRSTLASAFTNFSCALETFNGEHRLVLQSGTNTGRADEVNAYGSVRVRSASTNNATILLKLVTSAGAKGASDALAVRRPANASVVQVGDAAKAPPVTAVILGKDGEASLDELSYSAGFTLLDNITDISLLAVPGVGTSTMMDAGMAYCENRPLRDLFYLGDMDQYDDTAAEAEAFRQNLTKPNSYGAIYYPWVKSLDLSGQSQEPVLYPPSGYIAGLYSRIDANRGVWKAPAGTEASLSGVVGLAHKLTETEHGNLNPLGVNCLRQFAAAGIVCFGARTVTADPEYLYVPVRRLAILLRVSIYNGIQWAVFEPNDEPLWSQLRLNIGSFMMGLFRRGAFQGSTPSQAFFVKCDSETTTQDDINLGIVNVMVGFAPLKPTEFVVVKISQKAGQAS